MRTKATALVTLAAVSTLACSGGCPTLEQCDIRDSSCQQHTHEVAACLRGGDASSVALEVVDAAAFVEERVLESSATPEAPGQRDLRRGLALFALMPASDEAGQSVRDYWSRVGAFYSSEQQRITVLDWGDPLDSPLHAGLLLHEIVHAMQHSDAGLTDEQHYSTYDEGLAFRAVIEGEAVLYQDLAMLEGYGRDPSASDFARIFGQFRGRQWRGARGDRSPFELARQRFSYAFGGDYVNRAWRAGGNTAVREALASPPSSTRQVLAGYAASAPGNLPWNEDPNEVGMPVLSAEFEHVATLHLGTWLFAIWQDLFGAGSRFSTEFSDSGFAGDVMTVFRLPASGNVVAFWRLRFGSAEQAAAASLSIRAEQQLGSALAERDLIVFADTRGTPDRTFLETLAWQTATPDDWENEPVSSAGLPARGSVACTLLRSGE